MSANPGQYVVRYGTTRILGDFACRPDQEFPRHAAVIVRSERGVEWGEVLCPATDQAREHLDRRAAKGRILRPATEGDWQLREEIKGKERDEFVGGTELIREHGLPMQLVDVDHLFGGERVVFYYLSEERVDFRELVKSMAKRFKTRIEMRQIGVRDEAKLLADYGDCGRPVCCNTHLAEMPPVSMKMAKIQKATLDPTKISGRCGRLKCCLRYEYDTYEAHRRELPKMGATVVTRQGQGRVIGLEILARKILVDYDGSRQILTDEQDVLTVVTGGNKS